MSTMLDAILERTRADLAERKRALPLERLVESAIDAGSAETPTPSPDGAGNAGAPSRAGIAARRLRDALAQPGISVIAEIKRRSPSGGVLRDGLDPRALAASYEAGGASALSVLTDEPHFGGSLQDLRAARAACSLPILRKDFVVDEYQLHEAALAGADAALLIVAALTPAQLAALHERALALGLDPLIEVHDEAEVDVALSIGAQLIGVNNRDLRDFSVDMGRTLALVDRIPGSVTVVSESGIGAGEQLAELERAGVAAVLVGGSLVRAEDPGAALKALLESARQAGRAPISGVEAPSEGRQEPRD